MALKQPTAKTLYTPVFFSSSEQPVTSGSSSGGGRILEPYSNYLNTLSRTHIALAQIVQEAPSSRPGSPVEDTDGSYPDTSSHARIVALRARVQEAWVKADGNPADGKWALMTHLLRMGVTSGEAGRWSGARADLPCADPPAAVGWINAATEAEWFEWEKKVAAATAATKVGETERTVHDKVESWKRRLDAHEEEAIQEIVQADVAVQAAPAAPKSQPKLIQEFPHATKAPVGTKNDISTPPKPTTKSTSKPTVAAHASITSVVSASDSLKGNSPFGFAVVKRPSQPAGTSAAGKKPPPGKPSAGGDHSQSNQNDKAGHKAQRPGVEDALQPALQPSHEVAKQSSVDDVVSGSKTTTKRAIPTIRSIADIPEISFLPPSFPSSQMMTSTPNAAKPISSSSTRQKPEPIPMTAAPPSPSSMSSSSPLLFTKLSPASLINVNAKPSSPRVAPPPSSSSPRVTRVYGRSGLSQSPSQPLNHSPSLPAIPTTPTRNKPTSSHISNPVVNGNNKRPLAPPSPPTSPEPKQRAHPDNTTERALKKAKTMPLFGSPSRLLPSSKSPSQPRAKMQFQPPRTPTRPSTVSITSPLSAKVNKDGNDGQEHHTTPTPATAPRTPERHSRPLPTLMELLASAKKSKVKGKKPMGSPNGKTSNASSKPRSAVSAGTSAAAPNAAGPSTNLRFPSPKPLPRAMEPEEDNPYMLDPYAISVNHSELDLDLDLSPTKSLSSLAGSDSEEDDDDDGLYNDNGAGDASPGGLGLDLDFSFRPHATSTQQHLHQHSQHSQRHGKGLFLDSSAPTPASSGNIPGLKYNSQYNVADQIDRVDKLLEKDVDYGGWLRDPSLEPAGL
ncbi:hypothetical protein B0H34DRAFT_692418 [Crassisporium funariophilum]|nr:hypothetical protein B0H34DRAFT_692418 [Crassisporium funariophilum]